MAFSFEHEALVYCDAGIMAGIAVSDDAAIG
jgi:hypothetical protein